MLATANPDKAAEITEILTSVLGDRFELVPRPSEVPEVIEDADTFLGNARLKAIALATATDMPALADDSGLVVDALDGAPGVWSARYAGVAATDAENVALLLRELSGVAPPRRTARFVCVVVVRWPDGREVIGRGSVEGRIADAPVGAHGFGYDPVFVPVDGDGDGRTFAQLSATQKHTISHRGQALRTLARRLR